MNTKLSIALLSGISLFMSVGAFAVADERPEDYLNWSYAMGENKDTEVAKNQETESFVVSQVVTAEPTCTEGCPARVSSDKEKMALTLTYEDEAMPVADRTEILGTEQVKEPTFIPVRSKTQQMAYSMPTTNVDSESVSDVKVEKNIYQSTSQVETRYVTTPPKVQYPVTRQYPVSVQYPVTVQRNMTVEQPVIMQQPVIVRRPVVMQQDITVQRQPTLIQNQPVVMNQQPTYVQQQPMYIQAPAQPIPPAMMAQMMPQVPQAGLLQSAFTQQPMMQAQPTVMPQQNMVMPQMPVSFMPQNYQIQGQVQAQPVYMTPEIPYVAQQAPSVPVSQTVSGQQAVYPNPVQ